VAAVAAAALVLRGLAPYIYSVLAAAVLAAAVFSAGLLVPWTAGLLWLGIFAALASFANLSVRGPDGGPRRLAVALMLAADFAASQILGNKLLSLLPAALVAFALWRTGRPVAPAAIFAAALVAFALWRTGRSVAPAAIFAGAVLWSVVDDAGPAPAGADPARPGVAAAPSPRRSAPASRPFLLYRAAPPRAPRPAMPDSLDAAHELVAHKLGHRFRDRRLLRQALTHRSVAGLLRTTQPAAAAAAAPQSLLGSLAAAGFFSEPHFASNERLEFLGDAVLGAAAAEALFAREPPMNEGELTDVRSWLVREATLARYARAIGLGAQLFVGDVSLRIRDRVLADALEALIGAVHADAGPDAARRACLPLVDERAIAEGIAANRSEKNELQELLMDAQLGGGTADPPLYKVERACGPPHSRKFAVSCYIPSPYNHQIEAGDDFPSIKLAEKDAARRAVDYIRGRWE
jgi:ribonuclease-3